MSKYKGLFTFDVENHRYLPVEQADGLIAEMDYRPEQEPLIKDEKVRKAVRAWAEANEIVKAFVATNENINCVVYGDDIDRNRFSIEFFDRVAPEDGKEYTIAELCGEDEE